VSDFLDRVVRHVDGGEIAVIPVRIGKAECPWCETKLDAEQLCGRRCHASRVNRTDER
jgi:uncharacterized protein (UPF0212 family)